MESLRLSPPVLLAAALFLGAALAGCTPGQPAVTFGQGAGSLTVAALIGPQSVTGASHAVVTATYDGMQREVVVPVSGPTVTASLPALPVGDWTVRVELRDEAGDATHAGQTTVRVYPNQAVAAELALLPIESRLEIVADIAGFPGAETVEKVRVTFNNDRTVALDPVEGEPGRFSGVKELPPGDYDFSIALYKSTFYASDRVYTSPWTHVRLLPGKTSRVVWVGQTGDTTVETNVVDMPPAPVNLELSVRENQVWVAWEASGEGEPPLAFRIYYRKDPFAAFVLLAEVPGDVFEHPVKQVSSVSPEAAVSVTAVSPAGVESFRSAPAYLSEVVGA